MSKPKHPRTLADTEAQAIVSNIRISPRKLNLVAGMIRNLPAQQAVATLTFSKRRIAQQVKKALESAIANAENNNNLDPATLKVKLAVAGTATQFKRMIPKARGSAGPIVKRNCHIKIVLSDS